jgi:4-hydroxybenzoyl-CoA reductase subunit beta
MLRLPPFTYLVPRSLDESVDLIAGQEPDDVMLVAGGTDVYPNMKRQQYEPKTLVGLRQIHALCTLTGDVQQGLSIGAGMTLTQVSEQREIVTSYPALATAARLVSTPQSRNMGTLGGNLCVDTRCNYYNQTYWWRKAIGFCLKTTVTPVGSHQGVHDAGLCRRPILPRCSWRLRPGYAW